MVIKTFRCFGNFGVSVDGEFNTKTREIKFEGENGELVKEPSNPCFFDTQEWYEFENIKVEVMDEFYDGKLAEKLLEEFKKGEPELILEY